MLKSDDAIWVTRFYNSGKSLPTIATTFGTTVIDVMECLKREGVKLRHSKKSQKKRRGKLFAFHNQIAKSYEQGDTIKQLAQVYEVSDKTIIACLHACDVSMRRSGRPHKLLLYAKKIVEAYEKGDSVAIISDFFGVSQPTIRACLKRNGVELRWSRYSKSTPQK